MCFVSPETCMATPPLWLRALSFSTFPFIFCFFLLHCIPPHSSSLSSPFSLSFFFLHGPWNRISTPFSQWRFPFLRWWNFSQIQSHRRRQWQLGQCGGQTHRLQCPQAELFPWYFFFLESLICEFLLPHFERIHFEYLGVFCFSSPPPVEFQMRLECGCMRRLYLLVRS